MVCILSVYASVYNVLFKQY